MCIVSGDNKTLGKLYKVVFPGKPKRTIDPGKGVIEKGRSRALFRLTSYFLVVQYTVDSEGVLFPCAKSA